MPRDRILSAFSKDGIHWEREKGARIDVLDEDGADMVYFPAVLRVPKAEREWLMIYYGSRRDEDGWTGTLYRASSTDGKNWISEGRAVPESDPTVTHLTSPSLASDGGGTYLTYLAISRSGESRILAINLNTVEIVDLSKVVLPNKLLDVSTLFSKNLGWFLYFTVEEEGKTTMYVISSSQFGTWDSARRVKVEIENRPKVVCNPSLVETKEGMRIFLRGGDRPVLGNAIFTAVSKDGIHFADTRSCLTPERKSEFERHGLGFPCVTALESGFRMHYAGFWGKSLLSYKAVRNWEGQERFLP